MNEIEWKKEARRIAIAFDVSPDTAMKVETFQPDVLVDHYSHRIVIDKGDFDIHVWVEESPNNWSFLVGKLNADQIDCPGWPDDPFVFWRGNHSQYTFLLICAMYRLGFDISLIESQFNLTISAHEKLEWQLEFARRMREEIGE